MGLELTGSLGGQGARGPPEMRESRESQGPQERRARPATRETRDQMAPPETGVALGREDHGGPQVCGAREETRVKLDPQVTRDEKALSASPETRVTQAPLDLKGTEVTRGPWGPRVPEAPQGPRDPPETPG